MGAGILPISLVNGTLFFLFGKETDSHLWSDFGGSSLKEETIYVLEGVLIVWKSKDIYDHFTVMPGNTYHVKPNVVHRFGSPEQLSTVILECSTIELDDVVRLADDYNRN